MGKKDEREDYTVVTTIVAALVAGAVFNWFGFVSPLLETASVATGLAAGFIYYYGEF